MKRFYLLIFLIAIMPIACKHSRAVQKSKATLHVDSVVKKDIATTEVKKVDSVAVAKTIEKTEATNEVINIARNYESGALRPFRLFGEFSTTYAKGDTSRLQSDNASVSFWVNENGKMAVLVEGKKDTAHIISEQITIQRGKINTDKSMLDSIGKSKLEEKTERDKSKIKKQEDAALKELNKSIKTTRSPGWLNWAIVVAVAIAAIYIIIKRSNILGWVTNLLKLKK